MPKVFDAELTAAAWARYNKIEADMLTIGLDSFHADILTPSFDRLAKSGLKVAVLIAATKTLEDRIVVDEGDLLRGFYYIEQWRQYTLDVLNNIGRTTQEKQIEQIRRAIFNKPGVMRSELMQFFHLNAREADMILSTLDQRGLVTASRVGRGSRLYPIQGVS
jgi:hypothetical protein